MCISYIQISLKSLKDTDDTQTSDSYIDLHLEMNNEWRFKTKLYDKHDDFSNSQLPHSSIAIFQ